ncbi:hypothetical protein AVEN_168029-1 [Araneus ventricosus]|uniref:Uncharacterized protein n=1 Tax=Araneus ventricosus TaxID=182803 RepID=A0A4Y2JUQ1_ARAVE|nr:hypothetical protein AVEN_168029-1 [Araneus ventricosus]
MRKIEEALTILRDKNEVRISRNKGNGMAQSPRINLEQKQITIEEEEYNLDTEEDIKIYTDGPRQRMEWTQPTVSKGMTPG